MSVSNLYTFVIHVYRKEALEVERARAAEIASMPPPPPDPLHNLDIKKSSKSKLSPYKKFSSEYACSFLLFPLFGIGMQNVAHRDTVIFGIFLP